MENKTRPSMAFSDEKDKSKHSIESALIQASSKGYTIDMILGNQERRKQANETCDDSSEAAQEFSDSGKQCCGSDSILIPLNSRCGSQKHFRLLTLACCPRWQTAAWSQTRC